MIRILVVFVALFGAALVCVYLLPNPPRIAMPRSAVAAELTHEADPAKLPPNVRVVYPAPDASVTRAFPVRSASVDSAPAITAPPSSTVRAAAEDPQVQSAAPIAVPVTLANAAIQSSPPGLNLNTASIDALNQIPGAGHIGRMIASHRPYHSVEDLLAKRVIRKSVYDRIKDQLAAE